MITLMIAQTKFISITCTNKDQLNLCFFVKHDCAMVQTLSMFILCSIRALVFKLLEWEIPVLFQSSLWTPIVSKSNPNFHSLNLSFQT